MLLGRGVGALLGGVLMEVIGSVETFRVFGYMSLVSGVIYAALHFGYFKNKIQELGKFIVHIAKTKIKDFIAQIQEVWVLQLKCEGVI